MTFTIESEFARLFGCKPRTQDQADAADREFDRLQAEIEAELAEPLPVVLGPAYPISQKDGE